MPELGLGVPFWVICLIWLAKVVLLVVVSALLAWLGVRAMDALIRQVDYHERIRESPMAIGVFIAGFFILIGLVIHGAITALTAVTAPIVWYIFDFRTWGILAVSFVISLLLGLVAALLAAAMTAGYAWAFPSEGFYTRGGDTFDDWDICRTTAFDEDGFYQISETGFRPVIAFESLGEQANVAYSLGEQIANEYSDPIQRAEAIF